uniref:Phosphatidylinositol 4-kinase type 2 n=1 Tax=Ditylenchus dipsaci TaxID=166011 RepID=A0A915EV75_9BILA
MLKWLHKLLFPCCFGRSCLVPNQGYLTVVSLAAPTFNYSAIDRTMSRSKERLRARFPDLGRHFRRIGLPPKKEVSTICERYQDAIYWLRQWELYPEQALPPKTQHEFQLQFENMVVLDYIISQYRANTEKKSTDSESLVDIKEVEDANTGNHPTTSSTDKSQVLDSSLQGPIIDFSTTNTKSSLSEETGKAAKSSISKDPQETKPEEEEDDWEDVNMPHVSIAAIDNGLAFPFKHPDAWRAVVFRK